MRRLVFLTVFVLGFFLSAFSYIYMDDFNVVGPNEDYSFHIYTSEDKLDTPVELNVYRLSDPFKAYLDYLSEDGLHYSTSKQVVSYNIQLESTWQRETVPANIFGETGGYFMVLQHGDEKQYAIFEKTNINGVVVDLGEMIRIKVWNALTGEPVEFGDVYTGKEGDIHLGSINSVLSTNLSKDKIKGERVFLKTPEGNAYLTIDPETETGIRNLKMVFLSDKPIYRPGDEIKARAYLFDRVRSRFITSGEATCTITDPMGTAIYNESISFDESGGFAFGHPTVEEAVRGHYDVRIQYGERTFYRYIELADYQKPPFTVETEGFKDVYGLGESPRFSVSATYYFGQMVSQATVHEKLTLLPDYEDRMSAKTLDIRSAAMSDGHLESSVALLADGIEHYEYDLTVTGPGGREVSERVFFKYVPSDVSLKAELEDYWIRHGDTVNVNIFLETIKKGARTADRKIEVRVIHKDETVHTETLLTNREGEVSFDYKPGIPGHYTLEFIDSAYPANRIEKGFFDYSGDYGYSTTEELTVIRNKETFVPGDLISLKVLSAFRSLNCFAVIDFGNSVTMKNIRLRDYRADLSFILPEDTNRDPLKIDLYSFYGGKRIHQQVNLPVNLARFKLDMGLTLPERIRPGDHIDVGVSMKDEKGNEQNGFVTLNIIDQSLLDLYGEDDWKRVLNPLMSPPSNYRVSDFNPYSFFSSVRREMSRFEYDSPETLAQTKAASLGKSINVRSDFSDSAVWLPALLVDGSLITEVQMPQNLTTWRARAIGITESGRRGYVSGKFLSTLDVTVKPVFPKFLIAGDRVRLGVNVGNTSGEERIFEVYLSTGAFYREQTLTLPDKANSIVWFDFDVPNTAEKESLEYEIGAVSGDEGDKMVDDIPLRPRAFVKNKGSAGIVSKEQSAFSYRAPVESEIEITLSAALEEELLAALRYLLGYPYGCTEQTVSSFLPALAYIDVLQKGGGAEENSGSPVFEKINDITKKAKQRLYAFQQHDGGWGWWRSGDSDAFMTAYVMYTFYKLEEMASAEESVYDVNDSSFNRGLEALRSFASEDTEEHLFSRYVLALLDPSYTMVLTNRDSLSAKLFLAHVMVERGQKGVAGNLLDDILREGNVYNDMYKVDFDRSSYFVNQLQLNALLFELMIKADYAGERLHQLFNYLYNKKTGDYWHSTKDTAFTVMALSHFLNSGDDSFRYNLNGDIPRNGGLTWPSTGTLSRGETTTLNFNLKEGETVELFLDASEGLMWKMNARQTWNPLEIKEATDNRISRHFEVRKTVKSYDAAGGISYRNIYVPLDTDVVPGWIRDYSEDNPPDNNALKPVEIRTFTVHTTPGRELGSLMINGSDTGLKMSASTRVMGMSPTSLLLSHNPWNYEKGLYEVFFISNDSGLRVGDRIRTTFEIDLPLRLNWAALEEWLPSCFVQDDAYPADWYGGKYFGTRPWLTGYSTSHVEERYDRTTAFFSRMDQGNAIYQNNYRIISAGEFLFPPARLFEMYNENTDLVVPGKVLQIAP